MRRIVVDEVNCQLLYHNITLDEPAMFPMCRERLEDLLVILCVALVEAISNAWRIEIFITQYAVVIVVTAHFITIILP